MKVNDEVRRIATSKRKFGHIPSMFKDGYWVNDIERAFELWLYSQGYRPGDEHMMGKTTRFSVLDPKEINEFSTRCNSNDWLIVVTFASKLENLQKLTAV